MKVNLELYSPQMLNVFQKALRCAKEKGHRFLGSEHLLWGLAKETGFITEILGKYGLDANLIGEYISRYDNGAASGIGARAIQMSGEADTVLGLAQDRAKEAGHEKTEPEDLLYGIAGAKESAAAQLLASFDISLEDLKKDLEENQNQKLFWEEEMEETEEEGDSLLWKFGKNMTEKASQDEYDPVIGREDVVDRLIQVLSRRTKNNPV